MVDHINDVIEPEPEPDRSGSSQRILRIPGVRGVPGVPSIPVPLMGGFPMMGGVSYDG